jgi:signal transduction histidine kinase
LAANQIVELASEDIRSNAKIQARDLGSILSNALGSVATNLGVLNTIQESADQEGDLGSPIYDIVQQSSGGLIVQYLHLNDDGELTWTNRNPAPSNLRNFVPNDFAEQVFGNFSYKTKSDDYNESVQNVPILSSSFREPIAGKMYSFMAYPNMIDDAQTEDSVFSQSEIDVTMALISFDHDYDNRTSVLQRQASDEVKKNIILLADKDNVILESNNKSLIGMPISSFFNQLTIQDTALDNASFNSDLLAVEGMSSLLTGSFRPLSLDVLLDGRTMSLISEPVYLGETQAWTLYVLAPHLLTRDVNILFELQNNFSSIMIIIIGIVAFVIALIILLWNKGLEEVVNRRTSDLRKMNNSLLAANERLKVHDLMQKEFLNVASHEMKTPTQTILLHSSLLSLNREVAHESVDAIIRNAERLQKLVNDILDITRIESKSLKLNKEKLNLNDVIISIIEEHSSHVDSGKLNVLYSSCEEFYAIGDKARITQVISNLIDNAIKFTKEGFISISTELIDSDHILVSITDTGQGIDPQIFPRIFDKFVTKSEQGTGLGLYVAKSIIEAHGQKICAHNNNAINKDCPFSRYHPFMNTGSTFSFTLSATEMKNE